MRFLLLIFVAWILKVRCKVNSDHENLSNEGNLTSTTSLIEAGAVVPKAANHTIALDWDEIRNELHASVRLVMRCSRRFYPGLCSEPVHSVWTYSLKDNRCIERLGCKQLLNRSNRFQTLDDCTHTCKSLNQVYTYVLAYEKETQSKETSSNDYDDDDDDEDSYDSLRKGQSARRKTIETLENLLSTVEYNDDEETLFVSETREAGPPEEVQREMPVDIDSVPADYMNVQYDFNTNRYRSPKKK